MNGNADLLFVQVNCFFVDNEYAGTVKLTNLDNGEFNMSFPSFDDGLMINATRYHIK